MSRPDADAPTQTPPPKPKPKPTRTAGAGDPRAPGVGGAYAWFVWALGASTFAYAFFQRVAPSVMVDELMIAFAASGAVLGNLSAIYFYVYAGLQPAIGVMLDRWGARAMIAASLAIAAAGSAIFGLATAIGAAYVGRFLIGIGCAVGFVGTLSLAARWFPPHRFAFVSGLTMMVAMLGAILWGKGPLGALVDAVGWRETMLAAAVVAAALSVAIALFVRNGPTPAPNAAPNAAQNAGDAENAENAGGSGNGAPAPALRARDFGAAMTRPQTLLTALVAGSMTGPMLTYSGLWGPPHLMLTYGLDRAEAAALCSFGFIGWAVGSPFGGWLSDRIGRRRAPVAAATLVSLAAWSLAMFAGLPVWALAPALAVAGGAGGFMVILFALTRETAPAGAAGAAVGFVNAACVGAGALLQPVVGLLLDLRWDGTLENGARVYSADAYAVALTAISAFALAGCVAVWFLREPGREPEREPEREPTREPTREPGRDSGDARAIAAASKV